MMMRMIGLISGLRVLKFDKSEKRDMMAPRNG